MGCFLVGFSAYAQQTPVLVPSETTWQTTVDVKINAQDFAEKSEQIQKVDINFCENDGAKWVEYTYKLWSSQEICFTITNWSDKDVAINVSFVDGMLTNDQWKNKACWQAGDTDNFGQYVTWFPATIHLQKGVSKTEYAKVRLPKDISLSWSTVHGCLVYSLLSDGETSSINQWIGVVVRKAKFIDLHIQKGPSLERSSLVLVVILLGIGYRIYRKKMVSSKWK